MQQVTFDYSKVYDSTNNPIESAPRAPYWEAWRVNSDGNISTPLGIDPTDIFRTDPFMMLLYHGTAEIRGKVDFYTDFIVGANSPSGWGGHPNAGILWGTTSHPSWWMGSGFNHRLTVTWE